ncbi:MAG: FAD-dependent oxidoreductase, partial [Polyangia bacterium]
MTKQARRVVVLGGGMASLTAAYELTRPELDGAFDVTVYQQGWRLGGKGASGRNPHRANRIEEHGLHVWMGFYENAFRLIRDCYERLHREPGTALATWQDAFKPHSYIVFDDVDPSTGAATRWPLCFPEDGPGGPTPGDGTPLLTPPEYVPRILQLIVMLLRDTAPTQHLVPTAEHKVSVVARLEEVVVRVESLVRLPLEESLARLADLLESALHLAHHVPGLEPGQLDDVYQRIAQVVSHLTEPVLALLDNETLRHTRLFFDFAVTHLRGLVADGLLLPPFDFSRVDGEDYRDWLRRHGAREETVTSAPVTALYDLVFAVDSGMAAGATIACATRMLLTYKGALFYKMQAGMGDTVFTPLYLELKKRGVKFRFFHRVDELKLAFDAAADNYVVDQIVIGRQAATVDGRDYEPLVDVRGVQCWPSEPLWKKLQRGDELAGGDELVDGGFDLESHTTRWKDALEPLTLRRGDDADFDDVVLGISIAALGRITAALSAQVPQYKRMLEGI